MVETYGVFFSDSQARNDRHHSEDRDSVARFQVVEAAFQEGRVAAELVDHKAGDTCAIAGCEQLHRSDDLREDTSAVDVSDEQYGSISSGRHVHICKILSD